MQAGENKFKNLRFPAHEFVRDLDKRPEFAQLFKYDEFKHFKHSTSDKVVRYICFLYDPLSPLVNEFPDLAERKAAAAIEAGYKRGSSDEWPENVRDLFEVSNPKVVAMILRFLRIFKNTVWTEICTQEQELQSIEQVRWLNMNTGDLKDGDKLMAMADTRIKNLELLYRRFFKDHHDVEDEVKELEMITPETAQRILFDQIEANHVLQD